MQRVVLALVVLAGLMSNRAAADGFSIVNYLNIQYASKPSFQPGGRELLYLSNISGAPQVWRAPSVSGHQMQVTFDTNGVDGVWWSPAAHDLAVVSASVGGNERSQLFFISPYGSEVVRVTKNDNSIYSFGTWARDGSRFAYATTERNGRDFDIFEHNFEARETFELFRGEGMNTAASYSPDNRLLLIVCAHSSSNADLFLYDRGSGKTRLLTAHDGYVRFENPVWDAKGEGFYFLTDQGRDYMGLAYWPVDSAGYRWIETPPWDVEQTAISENGTWLAWTVNEHGYSRFYLRNLNDSSLVGPARLPKGVIENLTFSRDGSLLAFGFGAGDRPWDIWIYETGADILRQVTYSATGGVPSAYLRAPEVIEYDTFDGRKNPALWYLPSVRDQKLPVILWIHGGPESQARPDMSGLLQYFLSRGYAVLEPNIRGSSGYGKEYMLMDNVAKRYDAIRDIEHAARWLRQQPDVDPKKLIVYGGSYGGYMTLTALTTYPELWAAGISVVGMSNLVSFLENTGDYRRAHREAEYGSLATDRTLLEELSPLGRVDKIKAPLMLIQGANDPRVPQSESDQMAAAIRARGGIVDYLVFADEGHGLRKTANRIQAYSQAADFLDRYVRNR